MANLSVEEREQKRLLARLLKIEALFRHFAVDYRCCCLVHKKKTEKARKENSQLKGRYKSYSFCVSFSIKFSLRNHRKREIVKQRQEWFLCNSSVDLIRHWGEKDGVEGGISYTKLSRILSSIFRVSMQPTVAQCFINLLKFSYTNILIEIFEKSFLKMLLRRLART